MKLTRKEGKRKEREKGEKIEKQLRRGIREKKKEIEKRLPERLEIGYKLKEEEGEE